MQFGKEEARSPQAFVKACEEAFLSSLYDAADDVLFNDHIKILLLCGPTCSGKTTATKVLTEALAAGGKKLEPFSFDDFYRDTSLQKDLSAVDFESANALDLPLLGETIASLLAGKETKIPIFDFHVRRRVGWRDCILTDNSVLFFEGIQAFYPEIVQLIPQEVCRCLFISANSPVTYEGTVFRAREIRFLRRLVRDRKFRNTTAEQTFGLWPAVIKNEDENIYPHRAMAEQEIDSTLAYEPFVIAQFALPLLEMMPKDTPFENERRSLAERLAVLPVLPADIVPADSIFREFIGGKE